MSKDQNSWRTLIIGELVQKTPLTVSGSEPGDTSLCYRDGEERLVLPGTSLGGLLIESASRVVPGVIDDDESNYAITGKSKQHGKIISDELIRRSVLQPYSSWLLEPETVQTFWQQGVGIDQKTRTSAAKVNALYEQECVPTGTRWSFFLEIDTASVPIARELAIATLIQWMGGWAPLGRSPTRGNGFFELSEAKVYDLTSDQIDLWPDNRFDPSLEIGRTAIRNHLEIAEPKELNDEVSGSVEILKNACTGEEIQPWCFARFEFEAEFGNGPLKPETNDEYGLDALCVSGHESLLFADQDMALFPEHAEHVEADAPFAMTPTADGWKPTIGGGGVRGPIRHAASALARGSGQEVLDPNNSQHRDHASFEQLSSLDAVTQLFGWMNLPDDPHQLSSRLFVWESVVEGETNEDWRVVRSEHHAEDEFTAGTFASAKYNRDTMLKGKFRLTFQIEGPTKDDLLQTVDQLAPAFKLAKLGFVGLGGCKGVAGYTGWKFDEDSVKAIDALGAELDSTTIETFKTKLGG